MQKSSTDLSTVLGNTPLVGGAGCCGDSFGTMGRQHIGYKKGMAIASQNVNGLRSHLDEVRLLTNNLGIHILALNETKLDPNYPQEFTHL